MSALSEHRARHLLALLLAGDDSLTYEEQLTAVWEARKAGFDRGYRAGYDHGYELRGSIQHRVTGPSFAELCRRRGEEPDGKGGVRGLPRDGDFPGVGEAGAA